MSEFTPRTVVVLAGGISHERDVSLRSGRRVADSLQQHGITVILKDPDATLLAYLAETRPDVVWPALHGASGEDGALRGLLDIIGIPYVGSTSDSARLAWTSRRRRCSFPERGWQLPARSLCLGMHSGSWARSACSTASPRSFRFLSW